MPTPLLSTKLFIPKPRLDLVSRPRLIEQLNTGLSSKLILISAPAGFGKSTLLSSWVQQAKGQTRITWLSLDERDNDLPRFLIYFVSALQTVDSNIGQGVSVTLQSPGSVNVEVLLTNLINEIAESTEDVILIIDDYHVIEDQSIDQAITFLLDHLPPQMHLVIASRIDPSIPLSRLRTRAQLVELRADDLRFSLDEATAFLNQMMEFDLSAQDVAALGERTEGWIAGLHLAALSLQSLKHQNAITAFINRFTGSDRYIQDYLVDEVLQQQHPETQEFLLQTAILSRLSASLCAAITGKNNAQEILENLEAANLFIVPLDNERKWYRYHHLFGDLLRQRLRHFQKETVRELHLLASVWYEDNGQEIEAFIHATAANDVDRAEFLIEGGGVPLQYRGAAALILNWLDSQPAAVLDARPSLWVTFASTLNLSGQPNEAERKLQAAEVALQGTAATDKTNDMIGHIAAIRAMMAVSNDQIETIIDQSRRALEYLNPENLPMRTLTTWTLGHAYHLQGDRTAASQAYSEVLSNSQVSGDIISTLAAATGLGSIQVSKNQLYLAAESYRCGLDLFGDKPPPFTCETYLGLAKLHYEWNDLDIAEKYGQQSFELARQLENIDTFAVCGAFLAQVKLTQGDVDGALTLLAQAEQFLSLHNFPNRVSDVIAVRVLALIHQGDFETATHLAKNHKLPISRARVYLARGDASAALAVLEPLLLKVKVNGLEDQRLKVLVLQAVALYVQGKEESAVRVLKEALKLAEPGGFIRTFIDEGVTMADLLSETATQGIFPEYTHKLLAAFTRDEPDGATRPIQALIDPLSPREFDVLRLVAQGLTNREIGDRLYLAVDTIKGHNRRLFGKLEVQNRTEAVTKARELGLLES